VLGIHHRVANTVLRDFNSNPTSEPDIWGWRCLNCLGWVSGSEANTAGRMRGEASWRLTDAKPLIGADWLADDAALAPRNLLVSESQAEVIISAANDHRRTPMQLSSRLLPGNVVPMTLTCLKKPQAIVLMLAASRHRDALPCTPSVEMWPCPLVLGAGLRCLLGGPWQPCGPRPDSPD
jgi:hypothetical protein